MSVSLSTGSQVIRGDFFVILLVTLLLFKSPAAFVVLELFFLKQF